MSVKKFVFVAALCAACIAPLAHAGVISPNFADVPTGWSTDRYNPASFTNVGAFQGRSDVLGIGIDHSGDLANRPGAYQSSFYNTQGMGHDAVGGIGSVLTSDLYIPAEWRDAANGNVRTDMWGVASGGADLSYPIIGFTNYGGAARLRVWDEDAPGGWVDLALAIAFDAWSTLSIEFTGTSFEFSVNGVNVYSDATTGGSTGFSSVLMQAYNFADPTFTDAVTDPYVAHWANTLAVAIPEPGSAALCAIGLLGLAAMRRKPAKSSRG